MSTRFCIANAVDDALGHEGYVELPLGATPKLADIVRGARPAAPLPGRGIDTPKSAKGRPH